MNTTNTLPLALRRAAQLLVLDVIVDDNSQSPYAIPFDEMLDAEIGHWPGVVEVTPRAIA